MDAYSVDSHTPAGTTHEEACGSWTREWRHRHAKEARAGNHTKGKHLYSRGVQATRSDVSQFTESNCNSRMVAPSQGREVGRGNGEEKGDARRL